MPIHNNPSITEAANRKFNLKGGDMLPSEIQGPVATIEIQPHLNICKRASALNSTIATIFTTPSDKDFYLVAAELSLIKDATGTSTSSTISVIIEGLAVVLLDIAGITLTVQENSVANYWGPR